MNMPYPVFLSSSCCWWCSHAFWCSMRSFLGPENLQSPFLHLKSRFMASMICSTARARVLFSTSGFRKARHMGQLLILIEHPAHVRCPLGHWRILECVIKRQTLHRTISSSTASTVMTGRFRFIILEEKIGFELKVSDLSLSLFWFDVSQATDVRIWEGFQMLWSATDNHIMWEGRALTRSKMCLKSPGTPLKASSAHICPRTFETHFTCDNNWVSVHLAASLANCCWLFCQDCHNLNPKHFE